MKIAESVLDGKMFGNEIVVLPGRCVEACGENRSSGGILLYAQPIGLYSRNNSGR